LSIEDLDERRPVEIRELNLDVAQHGIERGGVVRNEYHGGVGSMLGLAEEVCGCDDGIGCGVDDDQRLARSCGEIDAADAVDRQLGSRDPRATRTNDQVDRIDRFGSIGEGGNRLRSAGCVYLVDAEEGACREDEGVDGPSSSPGLTTTMSPTPATRAGTTPMRTDDGYAARPAGHVHADTVDGRPPPLDGHSGCNPHVVIDGPLTIVDDPDVVGRGLEGMPDTPVPTALNAAPISLARYAEGSDAWTASVFGRSRPAQRRRHRP
jgi:hypothetical protein